MTTAKKWDMWKIAALVLLAIILVIIVYPLGSLLTMAFQNKETGAFTLEHFKLFFEKKYYYSTLLNSFKIAVISSLLSTALGLLFSYCYSFFVMKGRKVLFVLCLLCGLSAPFLGAYAWIFLFGKAGLITKFLKASFGIKLGSIYGFWGIVLVQVSRTFPSVVLYMNGAFRNIDASLLEASENLGIKGFKRFVKVVLPLVMPTLLVVILLRFLGSLADFGTPLVIGQGYNTFPLLIYEEYTSENAGGSHQFAAAVATISVLITLIVYMVQRLINGRFKFTYSATRHIRHKKAKPFANAMMHIFCYGIIVFSLLPQCYLVYLSFCNYKNSTRQPGYGFGNYINAWTRRYMDTALKNTIILGVCTIAVVILMSVFISYLVVRRKNTLNKIIDTTAMLPSVIPGLVIGVAMVMAYNNKYFALTGTLFIMILAITVRSLPSVLRPATAALQQIPMSTEEASLNLGASKMKTFFKVTVPMMKNGILSGAVLAWIGIITEVASSLILYNNDTITLTVGTYKVMSSMQGVGCAYATVETLLVILSLILYVSLTKEEDTRI